MKFFVKDAPRDDSPVTINVEVTGTCVHREGRQLPVANRRQLRGKARKNTVQQMLQEKLPPKELYVRKLASMSEDECAAGNTTKCHNASVLKQALHESRLTEQWHGDPIYELEIQREAWEITIRGTHVNGYIQSIGLFPFHVVLFLERQVRHFVRTAKEN